MSRLGRTSRASRLRVGAALTAVLLITIGAPAFAQDRYGDVEASVRDRARPDYDPAGLRFGSFDLRPSLEIGVAQTDNLFASSANEESDVVTTAAVRLEAASHWSRHALRAEAGAARRSHSDFSDEDATTGYGGLEARLDLGSSTQITLAARGEENVEARTSPDSPAVNPAFAGEPVHYSVREARAGVRHTFNRLRLSAAYQARDYDYDDTIDGLGALIDQDVRDRTEETATARAELALNPRVAFVSQAAFNRRDYDRNAPGLNRNSDGATYLVGANFGVTRLLRGEVTAGYLEQTYDDPAVGKVDGLAASAGVDWFPTQLTSVRFDAARTVEDAGFPGAASFLLSRGGVRVDHELRRNVIVSIGAEAGRREYRGIDRDDDIVTADLGARYLLNRRVVLSGGYRFEREDSSGALAGRNFEVNRVFVSVGLRI